MWRAAHITTEEQLVRKHMNDELGICPDFQLMAFACLCWLGYFAEVAVALGKSAIDIGCIIPLNSRAKPPGRLEMILGS